MDSIIQKLKTFESDGFIIKDINFFDKEAWFPDDGRIFNITTSTTGKADERLSFQLRDVDIYMARRLNQKGEFQFDLVVETQGRSGRMFENGKYITGTRRILKNAGNERRIQALADAFNQLKK